ncbi:hypothetical protein BASA62_005476 [Batrachochytrium salamandrivorans]|nr:hypothetical protein BASA62_005476 [Batrachochytrium salamandrivorans]
MWIDTAGTLPAGSQLTVLPASRLSCLIPNRLMLHSPRPTNVGPDLFRHLRLHRGAKYMHSLHPGSSAATQQSES